jgi:hypothetical protein
VLEQAVAAVRYASTLTSNVEFSAEDATRSDIDFLVKILTAVVKAGAKTINIPDTVGYTVPREYFSMIEEIRNRLPNGGDGVVISVHCHNDLGLATANSIAAIEAGARQVECTINGIGERAGNSSLEELVMALRTRPDNLTYTTNIVTPQIYPASRLVSQVTGIRVQPNKAIVGANAFAHEAGIHQDGVLKNKATYGFIRIFQPCSITANGFGNLRNGIVLTNDRALQISLHTHKLITLVLGNALHRNSGHHRYNLSHIFFSNFFTIYLCFFFPFFLGQIQTFVQLPFGVTHLSCQFKLLLFDGILFLLYCFFNFIFYGDDIAGNIHMCNMNSSSGFIQSINSLVW